MKFKHKAMNVKKYKKIFSKWIIVMMAFAALCACNTITEDLPPCVNYVKFTYTMNMKYVDAFTVEAKHVDLYIFDENDRFVSCISRDTETMTDKQTMELPSLPGGKYHLIAWAGFDSDFYRYSAQLKEGESTSKDLKVMMMREKAEGLDGVNFVQRKELAPLWHAETEVDLCPLKPKTVAMDMTKDTNKLRIVLQADGAKALNKDNVLFQLTAANGFLNFDNALLKDDRIGYLPYFKADGDVSENKDGVSVVVAELNTMRLMEKNDVKLKIQKKDGEELINIDLIKYLLLTKMEGHDMTPQEYLDRQDEYAVIFFLDANYMIVKIKVNGWTIRLQNGDF